MRGKRKPQQGIQSIEVGVRLLTALANAQRPQMLRDLARESGMVAAKAHRYLVSFSRMGLVEQQAETGLYDLGPFALRLGLGALARLDSVAIADPVLPELCAETGQTVGLAVWTNHKPTIVRWLGADEPVAASLRVGSVMPLTRSATGGAFLAFLPRKLTRVELRRELADNLRKGLTPTREDAVEASIAETLSRGFAHSSDFIPGVAGMAAPVFDHSGGMVLALVALGYSKPFEAHLTRISSAVMRAATGISERLGATSSG